MNILNAFESHHICNDQDWIKLEFLCVKRISFSAHSCVNIHNYSSASFIAIDQAQKAAKEATYNLTPYTVYGQESAVHVTLNPFAFHICLWLHLATMGAWRTLLSLWRKTDTGHEVRRKGKISWTKCQSRTEAGPWAARWCEKGLLLPLSSSPPFTRQTTKNQSLSSIWTRSQPSQLHKKSYFAVSPTEMKYRKTGLKYGHSFPLLLFPSCCEIFLWLGWNHLVTNNLPSLCKLEVHSLQGNTIYPWFTPFFPLKTGMGLIKKCTQGQLFLNVKISCLHC